ncbi:hypothetical protein [Tengunoibacter tsumagoiensis]|uniref:Uncharacterized protein n=1 Tax=Tengunoibacter tsumagoiensis TaxID=2014871 RepID=A0A402A423_9CHLR|nr:hypothetical protein [Tengunoibacter tsumagoiensis]GCE13907.1 hypothetical protein KTT_37660 [Tengunoibacter tsumagoiensis]
MKNMPSSSAGGSSDHSDKSVKKADAKHYRPDNYEEQMSLDYLIHQGFQWDEAATLLTMKEHLYDNREMRQRMEDNYRMQFVKWLREQGQMSDWE